MNNICLTISLTPMTFNMLVRRMNNIAQDNEMTFLVVDGKDWACVCVYDPQYKSQMNVVQKQTTLGVEYKSLMQAEQVSKLSVKRFQRILKDLMDIYDRYDITTLSSGGGKLNEICE